MRLVCVTWWYELTNSDIAVSRQCKCILVDSALKFLLLRFNMCLWKQWDKELCGIFLVHRKNVMPVVCNVFLVKGYKIGWYKHVRRKHRRHFYVDSCMTVLHDCMAEVACSDTIQASGVFLHRNRFARYPTTAISSTSRPCFRLTQHYPEPPKSCILQPVDEPNCELMPPPSSTPTRTQQALRLTVKVG